MHTKPNKTKQQNTKMNRKNGEKYTTCPGCCTRVLTAINLETDNALNQEVNSAVGC
jgi:hypothetical protein